MKSIEKICKEGTTIISNDLNPCKILDKNRQKMKYGNKMVNYSQGEYYTLEGKQASLGDLKMMIKSAKCFRQRGFYQIFRAIYDALSKISERQKEIRRRIREMSVSELRM